MAEFQKRISKFTHKGMAWNQPVDMIPEGKIAFARNIRATKNGELTQRPGLTLFAALAGAPTWAHSMSRLNNFSTDLNFNNVYVIGADQAIYVGDVAGDLQSIGLPGTAGLSGNPLTMVDAYPASGIAGWKYIGDSNQMLDVGFYPGDIPSAMPARALTMGMLPPLFADVFITKAAGNLTGAYQWATAFRRIITGARSNPSAASRDTLATPALTLTNQSVSFGLPFTPIDPQTGMPDNNILVDVYRFGGTVNRWALVGSGRGGTLFTDNQPDLNLLAAPSPPETVDPNTGITRFTLFKPFIVPDRNRSGMGSVTVQPNGTFFLTVTSGDHIDAGVLQGSLISINNSNFHIYEVEGTGLGGCELAEDATGILSNGGVYAWTLPSGTLVAGTPCPHIWGPYGTGVAGAVLFGCGAADAAGTLFWTNGNDPDSTDLVNSLVVTSASEPLTGGCVFNGTAYVFSTERMFQIFPSLQIAGQFYVQEVIGGKGMLMEWSLTVQTNSIADQSITWVGKDGIYDFSPLTGTISLTDASLYPFFPHDNTPGLSIGQIFPWCNEQLFAPDFNQQANPIPFNSRFHRLMWIDGELFYDFPTTTAGIWATLVFDSKNVQGWVCRDQYITNGTTPISRMTEIGGNNMKVALGGTIYDYSTMIGTRSNDDGAVFICRVITRADDAGDLRAQKLVGDVWVDSNPNGDIIDIAVLGSLHTVTLTSPTTAQTGTVRTGTGPAAIVELLGGGLGLLTSTIGLDLNWIPLNGIPTLYQWQYSFVPKPDIQGLRALDKTDDGWLGAKYMRGFVIECNTYNQPRLVNVLIDFVAARNPLTGTSVFTINSGTNTQIEIPLAIVPQVGQEFQISIDPSDTSTAGWEVFSIRWVWEKWPDLDQKDSPWLEPSRGPKPAYLRGFSMPIDTNGLPVAFQLRTETNVVIPLGTFTTPAPIAGSVGGFKTTIAFAIAPLVNLVNIGPVVNHQVRIEPQGIGRYWYDEIIWDAEEYPEYSFEWSPIVDCGYGKAKFMQGLVIPLDTLGQPVVFQFVNIDTGIVGYTSPAVTATGKQSQAFSWPPFIAHLVQIIPLGQARIWINEAIWLFKPTPELALTWTTPPMTHGLNGWLHQRLSWFAYLSTDFVEFRRSFSDGTSEVYTLPSSAGLFAKALVPLTPKKTLWLQYSATGNTVFKIFENDLELHTKQWGSDGPYLPLRPIGGPTVSQEGAEI